MRNPDLPTCTLTSTHSHKKIEEADDTTTDLETSVTDLSVDSRPGGADESICREMETADKWRKINKM